MIPRGADFPPDSAPPAKKTRIRNDAARKARPACCPSPCRPPSHRQEVGAAPGSRVATLRRPNARPFSAHAAHHDAGSVRPGHGPHGNSVDFVAFLRRPGPTPTRSTRLTARPTPRKNGNFSSSPKRCGGLANPANALGSSRGLFSISPRKKRTGSVSSRFSPDTLSCSCFLSLEHFLRSFSPRLRRRGKRVSAFQVLKFFKACVPAV